MNNNELISVVVPLYNKQNQILSTIDSLRIQTYTNIEILIVDDGSTDDSINVVNKVQDSRIRIIKKTNGGVSSARNLGIEESKGKWIFFLDADDCIVPHCIERLYRLSERYPGSDICTGNYEVIYPKCKPFVFCKGKEEGVVDNLKDFLKQKFYLRTGIFLVRRNLLLDRGLFNPQTQVFEDLEFFTKLLLSTKIAYTPAIVFKYIKGASDLSKASSSHKRFFSIKLKSFDGTMKRIMMDILMEEILIGRKDKVFISENWNRNRDSLLYIMGYFIPSFIRCFRNSYIIQRLSVQLGIKLS